MKQIPPVKAVMTAFPYSVGREEPLERALEVMRKNDIRHLPVVEGDVPVGLVTECGARAVLERSRRGSPLRVRDAESDDCYIVELTEPLDVVLGRMADRRVNAALVVKDRRLVGIFTDDDALRAFAEMLASLFPRDHDDDAA